MTANTSVSFWSAHVLRDIIEWEEFMNYTVAHHRDEILCFAAEELSCHSQWNVDVWL